MSENPAGGGAGARRFDRRVVLRLAFLVAALITIALAARFAIRVASLRRHAGEPPAAWMPIGYVARIHGVDPAALREALGLDPAVPDRRTLSEIAAERAVPVETVIGEVEAALARLKQASGG